MLAREIRSTVRRSTPILDTVLTPEQIAARTDRAVAAATAAGRDLGLVVDDPDRPAARGALGGGLAGRQRVPRGGAESTGTP
ncbi:MAG: hypothetical protein ABWY45_09360 [Mycobacterium sp.]